jgi:hypothetical protein
MKKIIFTILCSVTFFACQEKGSGVSMYLENPQEIEGKPLGLDRYLAVPSGMTIVNDTLLCLNNQIKDGKNITAFNLKTKEFYGDFVYSGRGPGEVVQPIVILNFPQRDSLLFLQSQTGVLNTFNIEEQKIVRGISFESEKTESMLIAPKPGRVHKMHDYYVGWGPFIETARFGIYDNNAKLLRFDGDYPAGASNMGNQAFFAYQGSLAANPEENYFAYGSNYCDNLTFYHVTENETKLIHSSQSYEPRTTFLETPTSRSIRIEPNCIISYTSAYGTKNFCFMLYSGKTLEDNDNKHGGGQYLIVFDWRGNHIKTFVTDKRIGDFCVNESGTKVYATTQNEDLEYDISEFDITL